MEPVITWIAASGWERLLMESSTGWTGSTAQLPANMTSGFSAEPMNMLVLGAFLLLVARASRKRS